MNSKTPIRKTGHEQAIVPTGRKVHKNFFLVNMGQSEQKELRILAAAFGIELRVFLMNAIRQSGREYTQMLRVAKGARLNPQFVFSLTASGHNNN
jgi:hypothetical protein